MNSEHPLIFWLWAILAALGGAVTSISLRPYKEMTRVEIGLSFVVSLTFATFVGSAVAEWIARTWFGDGPINLRAFGAVMWFMAAAAHFLIPVGIARAKRIIRAAGTGDEER